MALTTQTNYPARVIGTDKGYNGVSLTEFATTAEPEIASGSYMEIGGTVFYASADESISGIGAIANDNQIYIYVDVTGVVSASTTAPTWDTYKQGWYNSLDRAVAGCYKDSGGLYISKWVYGSNGKPSTPFRIEIEEVTKAIYALELPTLGTYPDPVLPTPTSFINFGTVYINSIPGASISGTDISLPAGTYRLEFTANVTYDRNDVSVINVWTAYLIYLYNSTTGEFLRYTPTRRIVKLVSTQNARAEVFKVDFGLTSASTIKLGGFNFGPYALPVNIESFYIGSATHDTNGVAVYTPAYNLLIERISL